MKRDVTGTPNTPRSALPGTPAHDALIASWREDFSALYERTSAYLLGFQGRYRDDEPDESVHLALAYAWAHWGAYRQSILYADNPSWVLALALRRRAWTVMMNRKTRARAQWSHELPLERATLQGQLGRMPYQSPAYRGRAPGDSLDPALHRLVLDLGGDAPSDDLERLAEHLAFQVDRRTISRDCALRTLVLRVLAERPWPALFSRPSSVALLHRVAVLLVQVPQGHSAMTWLADQGYSETGARHARDRVRTTIDRLVKGLSDDRDATQAS